MSKASARICYRAMAIAGIMVVGLTLSTDVANAQGPSGGDRRAIIQSLSDEEKQKFFAMSPEEKQKFFTERGKKSGGGKAAAKSGGAAKNGGGRRGRGGRGGQRPPPLVELAKVQTAPLIRIFPITGRLVPRQQGAVAARIEGRVANILVQIGERVKKGQVLAQLSRDRLKLEADLREAEVNQARAKLKSAQAQVTLINQEVK
ncbi:MAG: biotin/lipoyl-binding protein, partial [Rhodospirillales bacterium]|nr:biotin/lipoyl-binding protein [Rhodospirillales bacterium]